MLYSEPQLHRYSPLGRVRRAMSFTRVDRTDTNAVRFYSLLQREGSLHLVGLVDSVMQYLSNPPLPNHQRPLTTQHPTTMSLPSTPRTATHADTDVDDAWATPGSAVGSVAGGVEKSAKEVLEEAVRKERAIRLVSCRTVTSETTDAVLWWGTWNDTETSSTSKKASKVRYPQHKFLLASINPDALRLPCAMDLGFEWQT